MAKFRFRVNGNGERIESPILVDLSAWVSEGTFYLAWDGQSILQLSEMTGELDFFPLPKGCPLPSDSRGFLAITGQEN